MFKPVVLSADVCYTYSVMRTLTNNPAPASKDNLARLMAGENLRVEHDPQAPTASFDLKNRVLTLPVWKNLPEDTIDMLIGHEVSHALHTPPGDALEKACRRIAPNNPTRAQVYVNVVEDARIERLIKRDYPGLRRSFVGGYDELLSRDLFKIKGKNLAELGFLDRINLQYKIGHRLAVPFSAEELPLVQRVATTVSWEDVVALCKEIYEFCREQKRKERENNKPQDSKDGKSLPSDEQGEDQSDSEQDAEGQSDDESDSDPNGEDTGDSDADSNGEADENDQEESGQAPEGEEGQGDVSAQSGGQTDRDATDETGGTGNGRGGDSEEFDDTPDDAETVNAAKQELDKFADRTGAPTVYADLAKPTDRCVVPVKATLDSFRANYRDLAKYFTGSTVATLQASPAVCYNSWKKHHADAVQVLASEFDRRKAADEHKRTMVAETGVIDPNRLHAYRITDDIFLRNSLVRDGKNHGVVLLLDMSGSIHESFHNLVIQLVTLAHFCRRVNIPFRFYGFTDRAKGDTSLDCKPNERFNSFTSNEAFPGNNIATRLVTLLEDGMKTQEFVEQCGYLLHASYTISHGGRPLHGNPTFEDLKAACGHNNVPSFSVPNWFNLDQTPLNAALLAMVTLAPKFKAEKRVQVANLIVLTDGEASDSMVHLNANSDAWNRVRSRQISATGYTSRSPLIVWRDTVTRKQWNAFCTAHNGSTYTVSRGRETGLLVSIIRSYGINTVFMYAAATKRIAKVHIGEAIVGTGTKDDAKRIALRDSLEASLKDNGWFSVPECHGFTDYIVFTVATAKNENTLGAVDASTASGLRSLRNQFIKNQSGRRANRPLLARVAEVLSK